MESSLNFRHVKVLLRKDFLTLKRNWMFFLTFVILPIAVMSGFNFLESLVEGELAPERHNLDHTVYLKNHRDWIYERTPFLGSDMKTDLYSSWYGLGNVTMLWGCGRRRYIGVIGTEFFNQNFAPMFNNTQNWGLHFFAFNSRLHFEEEIKRVGWNNYCFGFELSEIMPGVKEVNITYMFPQDASLNTYEPLYEFTQALPNWRLYNMTMIYGTPHFMTHVVEIILRLLSGKGVQEIELAFLPMKTQQFNTLEPQAAGSLTMAFPFFLMLIYLLPLYYMVTKLAEEKESKAREGMKMMGLRDISYYAAWLVFLGALVAIMSALLAGTLLTQTLKQSDFGLVFAMCFLYGMNLYGVSFAITAWLPSKKSSATAASLIHLVSYYAALKYSGYTVGASTKQFAALIPNCAMAFCIQHLLNSEFEGQGLNYEMAKVEFQNFSYIKGLGMLAFDFILWSLVGLYFDQIAPRQFGSTKKWTFPLEACFRRKTQSVTDLNLGDEEQSVKLVVKGNFERENLQRDNEFVLKVRGLRKIFDNNKVAVSDASFTMYSGQIFALLGHNGAGKTTTISMLTGLLTPTKGQASLMGKDLFNNINWLREQLGVCPQHNILFDYLTAREHLEIYASFKGVSEYQIRKRVDKMIHEIELSDIQHQLASTLSGGQKRKLSVGIALIGDSKIIMLDEPTSGMDTTTRRRFWEMVKQYKQERIIILTTHYMDEADILGDRICIMAEGTVQCCGSSLFLKNRFGVGYNLVLAKKSKETPLIDTFIKKRIPEAVKLQEVSTEISYQLPHHTCSKFKDFFNELDRDLVKLNINSYGVGITTLEEVFLSIGHGENKGTTVEKIKAQTADLSKLTQRELILTEYSIATDHTRSFWTQFVALIRKRLLVLLGDRKSFIMDFFFPIFLIWLGQYLSTLELISDKYPKRDLSAYNFPQGRPFVHNLHNFNQTDGEVADYIERNFAADIGPGKFFSQDIPIATNTSAHFFDQVKQIDNYIFDHRNDYGPQYGDFFFQQVNSEERFYSIGIFVNASSKTAPIAYAGMALQSVMRDVLDDPEFRLNFAEHPLPFSLDFRTYVNAATGVLTMMTIAVAFMMISDQIVQSLIKERQQKLKHQIQISGGSKFAYWFSNFTIDFLFHAIPSTVLIISMVYYKIDSLDVWWAFALFCIANPIFIYAVSLLFDNDAKASVLVRVSYFGLGSVAPLIQRVLYVIDNPVCWRWADWLKQYYVWAPMFNLCDAYISITNKSIIALVKKQDPETFTSYQPECAGEAMYWMKVFLAISFAILVLAEKGFFDFFSQPLLVPLQKFARWSFRKLQRKKKTLNYSIKRDFNVDSGMENEKTENELINFADIEDEDPVLEERRVFKLQPDQCSIKVSQLTKSYDFEQKAVNNLSFGLEYGECFALLGVTGAGKTTTFKCLTGEEVPDAGDLFMGGHDVRTVSGYDKASCLMGYCPQFDAFFETLTVRQHLDFYARIKGINEEYREELIDKQIKEMDLSDYTHVQAGQLSGGNKRKLQCAIALIGNPPVVLLDEPSTGVDPQAKRFMWTIISNISTLRKKSTVILTTHSMEEAEALCTKIGIMVDGQFKCYGSSQHIKDKYGMGFEIEVKIRQLTDEQLAEKQQKLGEYVNAKEMQALLEKAGHQNLFHEVSENGFGSDLYRVLKKSSKLYVPEVLRWAHIEENGQRLIKFLESKFKEFELIEHYSNSYTFKVSRDSQSIGFVFGMMEDIKVKFNIQEYSVSQTSLEQIFNIFARSAKEKKLRGPADAAKKHN